MKIIEVAVFTFGELDEAAKEKAREWFKGKGFEYSWYKESLESIETFCRHFGVKLKDWSCPPHEPIYFNHDADQDNFSGLRLKDFDKEYCPTGYYLDYVLWVEFYNTFKKSGRAKLAFNHALRQAFIEWREDLEYQLSDESVDDNIIANDYTFDECGNRL